jgi:hypothetical protein
MEQKFGRMTRRDDTIGTPTCREEDCFIYLCAVHLTQQAVAETTWRRMIGGE